MGTLVLYIDSNTFIAYILREFGRGMEFMEEAFESLMARCRAGGHFVVLSPLFFSEVEGRLGLNKKDVLEYFKDVQYVLVECSEKDMDEARRISKRTGIHARDALHTRLALRAGADFVVTWDQKDFQKVRGIVGVATPREFAY